MSLLLNLESDAAWLGTKTHNRFIGHQYCVMMTVDGWWLTDSLALL